MLYLFYFSFLTTILTPLDPLPIPANAPNPAAGLSTYQAPPREKYTNILGIFCKLDSLIFTSACYDMTWNNMSTFPSSRNKNLFLILAAPARVAMSVPWLETLFNKTLSSSTAGQRKHRNSGLKKLFLVGSSTFSFRRFPGGGKNWRKRI